MLDNTCMCMYIILIVCTYPQILRNMYRNTLVPYINVFQYNKNLILTNIITLLIKQLLSKYKIQINLHFLGRDILDKYWKNFNRPVEPVYNTPVVVYLQGYSSQISFW